MSVSWKESIALQRRSLSGLLSGPLEQLAQECAAVWGDRQGLDEVLQAGFGAVPHCTFLYALGTDGVQISDNVSRGGLLPEHFGRDRSDRPYMKEVVPSEGFLLSDAYISLMARRPSLTALQIVRREGTPVGFLGADFDLRDLPVTAKLYDEPGGWRQIKGDPAIRGAVFQQTRAESLLDQKLDQALSILEELMTARGVFQLLIHFSTIHTVLRLLEK